MKIPQKGWLPLTLIVILTIAALVVSVISLIFGWQTIFQNLFYFPIILACIYYMKRGFVFSVILACCYFVLMAIFSQDPVILEGAFVRVLIFIIVAGVITYLSMVRGRAEESQQESETRLAEIIDFLPDPTFVIDRDGKVIAWNYAIASLLGVEASEIIGKGNYEHSFRMFGNRRPVLVDLILNEDDTVIKKHYPDIHRERGMLMAELDIPSLRGKHTALWVIATPLYNAKGEISGAIESMRDITHIHDTEEELRESRQLLSDIIDFLPDPTFAIDLSGSVIAWNRAIEEMLGIPKAEMLGKRDYAYSVPFYGTTRPSLIDLVLHEDLEMEKKYSALIRRGDQLIAEIFMKNLNQGNGEYLWLIASPLYDRNGKVRGSIESIRIVTDRKHAEEELRQSRQILEAVINTLPVRVFWKDRNLTFLGCNTLFAQDAGFEKPEQVIGKDDYVMGWWEQADRYRADDRLVIESGIPKLSIEEPQTTPSGERLHLLTSKVPLRDANGEIIGVLGTYLDITDRKRTEETLRQVNKKLNLLSSITRHDINNQLMSVNGFLELLHDKVPDPTLEDYFARITNASSRIASMIQFTKTYESIGVNEPTWQETRTLVDTAAKDVAMGKIQLVNDLPAGTEIYADPLIVKVFYNLMDNAMKYGGGGMTTIRVSSHESDTGLQIRCEDDGAGISLDDKKRLFERGFGKHTGFGLFLSREILAITGITIRENSEPGKGARFEIDVPKGMYR
jgi:PAS domain S-box-containing protein